jgi:hypothetical protein
MPPMTMTISSSPQKLSRSVSKRSSPRGFRQPRIIVLPGAIERRRAEREGQHQAGNDAGDEQLPDRGGRDLLAGRSGHHHAARRHGVHDHDDRGRDEDAERAGRGDDAGAEAVREALPHHRRQDDRADGDHGRRRGAGDRREQRAGQHAREPEAAVPMADHRAGEIDHAPRHAAMRQEIAGENEERDRHDLELLDAGEQFQRHRIHRHFGQREQEGQHRQAERDRDRHAGEHQGEEQREDHADAHAVRHVDKPVFGGEAQQRQDDRNGEEVQTRLAVGLVDRRLFVEGEGRAGHDRWPSTAAAGVTGASSRPSTCASL